MLTITNRVRIDRFASTRETGSDVIVTSCLFLALRGKPRARLDGDAPLIGTTVRVRAPVEVHSPQSTVRLTEDVDRRSTPYVTFRPLRRIRPLLVAADRSHECCGASLHHMHPHHRDPKSWSIIIFVLIL